jgi:hypothetical protein
MIYQTLQEATKARDARKIEIINIGLEPWEAIEMGALRRHHCAIVLLRPAHRLQRSGSESLRLHRRRYPIATDNYDRCLPRAIALLLPAGNEHMCASLQIGLTASDKVDDFGVARDDNCLLAILVFDLQRVPLDFLHLLRDRSIGHRAVGHQVPRIVSLTGPTQRLLENVNLEDILR